MTESAFSTLGTATLDGDLWSLTETPIVASLATTLAADEDAGAVAGPPFVEEYPFDRADVRAAFITMYTLVFVFCFFGNLLVIVVVTLSRRMRSLTNFFLANLAVADLCVGVFCVYQNLSIYLVQNWVLGDVVCKLYHFVHSLSYTASIFILVVVAVERYLAVLHPIKCRSILTPRRLKVAVAAVWALSGALCGSRLHWAQTETVPLLGGDIETICIVNQHKYNQEVWDVLSFVLLYLLPLAVMAFLYARIAAVLWCSGRGLGSPQPRARRGAVKLIVTVVGVFAVCHLPLHARRLWQHWSPAYRGASIFSAVFTPTTFLIAYANSAANPLLYALLSNNFRAVLKDFLGILRRGGGGRPCARSGSGNGSLTSRTTGTTELPLPTLRREPLRESGRALVESEAQSDPLPDHHDYPHPKATPAVEEPEQQDAT